MKDNGQLLESGGAYGNRPAGALGPFFQSQESSFQAELDLGKLRVVTVSPYSFNNVGVLLQEASTMDNYLYKNLKRATKNPNFDDIILVNYH